MGCSVCADWLGIMGECKLLVSTDSKSPPKQKARMLLHRCLAQFSWQQQIHAQQAAWYLYGKGDSMSSHETTPMVSGLLLDFLHAWYCICEAEGLQDSDDGSIEKMYLRIQTDQDGNLINNNQVMDYWYQSETLSHMNYYDFTHCITLNNKNSVKYTEKDLPQLRTLARHALQEQHPLTKAHHLLEHTISWSTQTRNTANVTTPWHPEWSGLLFPIKKQAANGSCSPSHTSSLLACVICCLKKTCQLRILMHGTHFLSKVGSEWGIGKLLTSVKMNEMQSGCRRKQHSPLKALQWPNPCKNIYLPWILNRLMCCLAITYQQKRTLLWIYQYILFFSYI